MQLTPVVATPYPLEQGPIFHCTRPGPAGTRCTWAGFPLARDRCPLHPTAGRHRYEPTNFDPLSFQPLCNYAERCTLWLDPSDYMAMGCRARLTDGAPTVLFAYKHRSSRNYIHIDALGLSAWTTGHNPEPVPAHRAVAHATGLDHRHDDGCLNGSRVVTLERRRKAG